MNSLMIYIHGKGGNAAEAENYKAMFPDCDVIGFDYFAQSPWEAKEEFSAYFDSVCKKYDSVGIVANSIGAFFAMHALADRKISEAYFISPVVNMEKLISDMMTWTKVSEEQLQEKKEIPTDFGETLSWDYLCYVREHPIHWIVPTHILYGENDHLTSYETISGFANRIGATLTVMKNGEHWFHTEEQMNFLAKWIRQIRIRKWNIYELQERDSAQIQRLIAIWEASVRATYLFLSEKEIAKIKHYVPQALERVSHLMIAERNPGCPVAFMGVEGKRLEMLFLAPEERGRGLGRQLLEYGIRTYGIQEVTVNEQNPQAVGFYQHIGFEIDHRTDCDEEGNPYPLLYLKRT